MTDAAGPSGRPAAEPRFAPVSPVAVLLPGILLLFGGLWMVTDGGSLPVGWALFAVGLSMLVTGAVAWGVAWGLELHDDSSG